jgi:hypothetical protein
MCTGVLSPQLIGVPATASLSKKYNNGQCFLPLEVHVILGLFPIWSNKE